MEKSNAAKSHASIFLSSATMLDASVICRVYIQSHWVVIFNKIMKTRECDEMSVEHIEELDTLNQGRLIKSMQSWISRMHQLRKVDAYQVQLTNGISEAKNIADEAGKEAVQIATDAGNQANETANQAMNNAKTAITIAGNCSFNGK